MKAERKVVKREGWDNIGKSARCRIRFVVYNCPSNNLYYTHFFMLDDFGDRDRERQVKYMEYWGFEFRHRGTRKCYSVRFEKSYARIRARVKSTPPLSLTNIPYLFFSGNCLAASQEQWKVHYPNNSTNLFFLIINRVFWIYAS